MGWNVTSHRYLQHSLRQQNLQSQTDALVFQHQNTQLSNLHSILVLIVMEEGQVSVSLAI